MPGCKYGGKSYSSCTITVVFDPSSWQGVLTVTGQNHGDPGPTALLTADVVGGPHTPMGSYHASYWETDHVSKKYGSLADTPYSKTLLGGNAFGPYQLHIQELESRGIYIHGTTEESNIGRPASFGCIRMRSRDVLRVFDETPVGAKVEILNCPIKLAVAQALAEHRAVASN